MYGGRVVCRFVARLRCGVRGLGSKSLPVFPAGGLGWCGRCNTGVAAPAPLPPTLAGPAPLPPGLAAPDTPAPPAGEPLGETSMLGVLSAGVWPATSTTSLETITFFCVGDFVIKPASSRDRRPDVAASPVSILFCSLLSVVFPADWFFLIASAIDGCFFVGMFLVASHPTRCVAST